MFLAQDWNDYAQIQPKLRRLSPKGWTFPFPGKSAWKKRDGTGGER
jgi:hypothetical protein